MTQLIFDRDEELATWAETQYPDCAPLARPLTSIGIASSEGEIIGLRFITIFVIVTLK